MNILDLTSAPFRISECLLNFWIFLTSSLPIKHAEMIFADTLRWSKCRTEPVMRAATASILASVVWSWREKCLVMESGPRPHVMLSDIPIEARHQVVLFTPICYIIENIIFELKGSLEVFYFSWAEYAIWDAKSLRIWRTINLGGQRVEGKVPGTY